MKKLFIYTLLIAVLGSCNDVLDKNVLSAYDERIWEDYELSTLYLNQLYKDNLPDWSTGEADLSDESNGDNDTMYGLLTESSMETLNTPYARIRRINELLERVGESSQTDEEKALLMGQAYFLRAWRYFILTRYFGGVPLIDEPQQVVDNPDIYVFRDHADACMEMIVADLDQAMASLPAAWDEADVGRITRGAAAALKGRVLLYYASEQFNPSQDITRWQTAYDANKAALTLLEGDGYGLFSSYEDLWFNELNIEDIFIKRYDYTTSITHGWEGATRPKDMTDGTGGANQPTLELINAYPMINGLSIDDPAAGYDADYFWKNRDPRFDASIAYNGVLWELADNEGPNPGRQQWNYEGAEVNNPTQTGFYCRKAVDEELDETFSKTSDMDWVEIRFAEVMLNFAEAAAEAGHTEEALEQLIKIRARAGIEPGTDNQYGLAAGMSQSEMRDAVLLERRIELAFEGKRYWDLRRRKMFDDLLNGTSRQGLRIVMKSQPGVADADLEDWFAENRETFDLDNHYYDYFEHIVVDLDTDHLIDYKDIYYFFAMNPNDLEKNPNLEQTIGWSAGTFDPLN